MEKLVVLTGSGISRESGLKTFRESGGLWENHDVMEVASPKGWERNKDLVLEFYNERRKQLRKAQPNTGHKGLVYLEKFFDVHIITQNVDDLHERAGSSKVLHLHGELTKCRSTLDPNLVYDLKGWKLKPGDKCEKGSQLRPHIVWFGEAVPAMEEAIQVTEQADIFVIIGTSMLVYPAASLVDYVPSYAPIYLIDPNDLDTLANPLDFEFIKEPASKGVSILVEKLTSNA